MTMFPNKRSLQNAVRIFIAFGVSSAFCFAARQETIKLENSTVVDQVTLDSAAVTLDELKHWMELSPILGRGNFMLVPEWIDFCPLHDRRYRNCDDKPDEWNPDLTNAQVNLDAISSRIEKLAPEHYPPELADVVRYIRNLQSYAPWEQQRELSFLKTNDTEVLQGSMAELTPA
ncbi:MAG: hypothetical protein ACRD3L_05160 [Terriglobales bacterium]